MFYCNDSLDYYADCVYSALLLHDICKADDTPEHKTVFEHPLLAGELFYSTAITYIKDNDTISTYDKECLQSSTIPTIKSAIESHMGQWNVSRDKKIRLPLPKKLIEHFVHMIDYLASRKQVEFNFNDGVKDV